MHGCSDTLWQRLGRGCSLSLVSLYDRNVLSILEGHWRSPCSPHHCRPGSPWQPRGLWCLSPSMLISSETMIIPVPWETTVKTDYTPFLFVCEQNLNIISNFFPLYAYGSLFVLHTLGKKKSLAGWLTLELLSSSTNSVCVYMCIHEHACSCMYVGLYHLSHLPRPFNLVLTQALFLLKQFSTWASVLFETTQTRKTKSLSHRHCNSIQSVGAPCRSAWHFLHFGRQAFSDENVWDVGSSSINGHTDQFLPT